MSSQVTTSNLEEYEIRVGNLLLTVIEHTKINPAITEKGTNIIIDVLSQIEVLIGNCGETREEKDNTEGEILGRIAARFGVPEYGTHIKGIIEEVERRKEEIFKFNDIEAICFKYGINFTKIDGVILNPGKGKKIEIGSSNGGFEKKDGNLLKIYNIFNILKEEFLSYGDDISIREGVILPGMMREKSYLMMMVPKLNRTIFICEAYGEATFVCNHCPTDEELKNLDKNKIIARYNAVQVDWNDNITVWKANIKNAVQRGENEEKFQIGPKIGIEDWENHRNILLSSKDILEKEAGVIFTNGIWYFGDFTGIKPKTKIGGRLLSSFPCFQYNRERGIGNKTLDSVNQGRITNMPELRLMIESLGFKVATDEEEKTRWRNILIEHQKILEEEVGIEVINGVWHFGDVRIVGSGPLINGKRLCSFPNFNYNRNLGIGRNTGPIKGMGRIQSLKELKKMFRSLEGPDMIIATDEDEKIRWGNILIKNQKSLEEIGIEVKNGVCHFGKCKSVNFWGYVNGIRLCCFPSTSYNIENGLGNQKGRRGEISTPKELMRSFEHFGIPTAK